MKDIILHNSTFYWSYDPTPIFKEQFEASYCMQNFENWKLGMVSFQNDPKSIDLIDLKLYVVFAMTKKNRHEWKINKCSNRLESEDELRLFAKLLICSTRWSDHMLHLV
jgi:hypothetical protein